MITKQKIAVTLSSFAEVDTKPFALLKKKGFSVVINKLGRKLKKEETLRLCRNCTGVIAGVELYDKEILKKLPRLKVISRCGIGIDSIDLSEAKKRGIAVLNTPDAPTLAVAELTVGLILALLRKITLLDRESRAGLWKERMGNLLSGKRVGIVGLGRIGAKVAALLKPFGCRVYYTDPFRKDVSVGLKRLSLRKLLRSSDIVSLHVPGGRKILGNRELCLIRKGACLINTSRGGIVDEKALHKALSEGRLQGAALDVFEKEPYRGPLKNLDNIILTPHIGSYAKEARVEMEIQAVRNLIKALSVKG